MSKAACAPASGLIKPPARSAKPQKSAPIPCKCWAAARAVASNKAATAAMTATAKAAMKRPAVLQRPHPCSNSAPQHLPHVPHPLPCRPRPSAPLRALTTWTTTSPSKELCFAGPEGHKLTARDSQEHGLCYFWRDSCFCDAREINEIGKFHCLCKIQGIARFCFIELRFRAKPSSLGKAERLVSPDRLGPFPQEHPACRIWSSRLTAPSSRK